METPSPRETNLRRPHPLAAQLIERLGPFQAARVLDFGSGSGRNGAALQAAGFRVCAVTDDGVREFVPRERFDAAVTTHALLHGSAGDIGAMLQKIAASLKNGAPLYATFGSKADARYGKGTRVDDDTYVPDSGDERGVAHTYFDESQLRSLIERWFVVESIEEHAVDEVVGTWAHGQRPQGTVHWFVRGRLQ
jgi:SAM-dependent methyltransferase